MKSTEIANIPKNYRKAQNIEDFTIGDIVCTLSRTNFVKGKVEAVTTHVHIKWDNCIYNVNYSIDQLEYLYVQYKPKFKVGDRVKWGGEGTVTSCCPDFVYIKWDTTSATPSYVHSYGKNQLKFITLVPKSVPKELTVDLALHFNLDTSWIETVLIDCVKATVTNGKYQEAKELCELLLSVQALAKPKDEHSKAT